MTEFEYAHSQLAIAATRLDMVFDMYSDGPISFFDGAVLNSCMADFWARCGNFERMCEEIS